MSPLENWWVSTRSASPTFVPWPGRRSPMDGFIILV